MDPEAVSLECRNKLQIGLKKKYLQAYSLINKQHEKGLCVCYREQFASGVAGYGVAQY